MNEHKYIADLAEQFTLTGYRGTTTAMLAKRLGVRENVLYRVWPSKREMFIAAIRYIQEVTMASWEAYLAETPPEMDPADWLLARQAEHHGQLRLYRIVYAGILEEDPAIHSAIREVYLEFHRVITALLESRPDPDASSLDPATAAWAIMGLGAIVDIQRELELAPEEDRASLLRRGGARILNEPEPKQS